MEIIARYRYSRYITDLPRVGFVNKAAPRAVLLWYNESNAQVAAKGVSGLPIPQPAG